MENKKEKKTRTGAQVFQESAMKNRLILSIGTKGSGKTFLMLKFLKHCFDRKLYKRYVLVLPAFKFEQNDSYSFIDPKDPDVFVFDGYHENISSQLMTIQKKGKGRMKTLFILDDASGENIWKLDPSLQRLITVIRHLDITLWLIVHAATGVLSPFLRAQCDILLLSKMTNHKLLESIWEEYLSITSKYKGREGHRSWIDDFIQLMDEPFKVIFIDMRNGLIDTDADKWSW